MRRRLFLMAAIAAMSVGIVVVPGTAGAQETGPNVHVFMGPKFRTTVGVAGFEWPAGSTVEMQIDNGNNGSVEYTASTTVNADGGLFFPSNGTFSVQAGDLVSLTDDALPGVVRQVTVEYMTLTSLDPATDTVAGTASPGGRLIVWLRQPPAGDVPVGTVTADSAGRWSLDVADFGYHLTYGESGFINNLPDLYPQFLLTQINWDVLPTSQWLANLQSDASSTNSTPVSHVIDAYVARGERLLAQGKTSVVCTQTNSLYQPIQEFQKSGAETVQQAWQLTQDVGWVLVSLGCQ